MIRLLNHCAVYIGTGGLLSISANDWTCPLKFSDGNYKYLIFMGRCITKQ